MKKRNEAISTESQKTYLNVDDDDDDVEEYLTERLISREKRLMKYL